MAEHFEHNKVSQKCGQRLAYLSAGKAEIEQVPLHDPGKDDVVIEAKFSGISRGTEALVFNGLVPVSEHDRMRCPHMAGSFEFPISYGYCCVGEVVKTGSSVTDLRVGDRVFVLHPHQSRFVVSASACNPIPEGLPLSRAVLAANMETALNAVWDADFAPDALHRTAIVGGGVVGLLTAHAINETSDFNPVLFDIDPRKKVLAEKLGFELKMINEAGPKASGEFDHVFHTSATSAGLQTAIDLCGFEGTIVEMSWYGSKQVLVDLGGAFHSRRLTIKSSQVGSIAPSKRATLHFSDRMQLAMQLLRSSKLDHLLESAIDFEDLPGHLPGIFKPGGGHLCQLVRYR